MKLLNLGEVHITHTRLLFSLVAYTFFVPVYCEILSVTVYAES